MACEYCGGIRFRTRFIVSETYNIEDDRVFLEFCEEDFILWQTLPVAKDNDWKEITEEEYQNAQVIRDICES